MNTPIVIAFYLPQYHPFPENENWWGKGFTEWTNVAKAKPLYHNHYQPKIPADLGFYDLRISEIREQQAELAKNAGIYGFCYYHYWFGEKELMNLPFDLVVQTGEPVFPFCLCWANESWHSKFWNKDGSAAKKLLIEQRYLGKEDNEKHFYKLLNAFRDPRYIKVNGKLLFSIYKPLDFDDFAKFKKQWNNLAVKNGLNGFYFIGQTYHPNQIDDIINLGFDAVNLIRLFVPMHYEAKYKKALKKISRFFLKRPFVYKYKDAIAKFDGEEDEFEHVIPTIIPNFDHSPRSTYGGYVLHGSTPALFEQHVDRVLNRIKNKNNQLLFLKSWNEWGEGNYMEPDLRYGHGYLNALSSAEKKIKR